MTYQKSLTVGTIIGFLLIGVVTGVIYAPEEARVLAKLIGTFGLIVGFSITATKIFKKNKGSVFSPNFDGFISGFGFATAAYSIAMYGIGFP
jgi:cyanate permease